ncbi:MAG TPA: sigma factor-like helix-turn-helix DNA-binding protein [Terriglobales bacterium]|nr:sigma factor-like helix-turn-helix DNA-binding protein [Terriglobales bacterium]
MNVHISAKSTRTPEVDREINHQVEKLGRRLQVFRPELVHLHGSLEPGALRHQAVVSLNLRLPSGELAAEQSGPTPLAAVKAAFSELLAQVNRHKEQLRNLRRRRAGKHLADHVPLQGTVAAVHLPTITDGDIRSYVDANLERLEQFVDRELLYRETTDQLLPGLVTREEVLDEAIAHALSEAEEKPELLSLERWLYRLAIQAIRRLSAENGEAGIAAVPLEQSARRPNVRATDDAELQFHQPDEIFLEESVIPDRRVFTPEQIAESDETVALVESALRDARRQDREAFILFAIEGFTVEEIAAATDRTPEEVNLSLHAARARLQTRLPRSQVLRGRPLQRSGTA